MLSPELSSAVAEVVPAIDRGRLARGKGGEVMRSALCRLITTFSGVGLPLTPAQQDSMWAQICDNLRHASPDIQRSAVAALAAFAARYMVLQQEQKEEEEMLVKQQRDSSGRQFSQAVQTFLLELREKKNVAIRRGAALALGALPR